MIEPASLEITAIAPSDRIAGCYFLYGNNRLYRADASAISLIAKLPNLKRIAHKIGDGRLEGKELEINIYVYRDYVCVTERFGVNAALVNLKTGKVRKLKREDYHCDVSSYSIGFVERDGRILLIHQTQWNRLDILDAKTGEILTEREVSIHESDEKDDYGGKKYVQKNYLDYFHSLIHVSPDGKHFLSNGWVWSPQDHITLFDLDAFMKSYEKEAIFISYPYYADGYNWDRPCCFIDNETFAVILDDARIAGLDPEEEEEYEYKQLALFKTSDVCTSEGRNYCSINPYLSVKCTAFQAEKDNYGEVHGRLYYDAAKEYLVAVTPNGSSAVSLSGEVLQSIPEAIFSGSLFKHEDKITLGYAYSSAHHILYTWKNGIGIIERKFE